MEDNKIKRLVEKGLLKKAPTGMMDRIMANLVVNPVRRLSIKPVEPTPVFAILLSAVMAGIFIIGIVIKPEPILSSKWNMAVDITINPVWVAPILVLSISVWTYIIANRQKSKT